jgi:hypothetical protein
MSESLFVAIVLVVVWASLPVSLIIALDVFDRDVVKEGEQHH